MARQPMPLVRGRVVALEPGRAHLLGEEGIQEVAIPGGDGCALGDLVIVEAGVARVVARALSLDPGRRARRVLDPRRLRAMAVRGEVEAGIRAFFAGHGFREVRTPVLVRAPGTEPHLRPFEVAGAGWLHTSPELAMKKLLVGGLERIFQMCPVFRDEPPTTTHRPEFTMLEWYRAWADDKDIMRDVEELLAALAQRAGAGVAKTFARPFARLRVRDLFREHAGVDLVGDDLAGACRRLGIASAPDDTWDDRYFRIWLERIEPRLPRERAVFVTRFPASQAALARCDLDPDGTSWARRFEVYAGGLELGNAFAELCDADEQRRRFRADLELRERRYGIRAPADEDFLAALDEGMPPSAGIAMGLDRIAMLLAGEDDIDYVQW